MTTIRFCDMCGARIDVHSTQIIINGIWNIGYESSHFTYDLCPSCLEKAVDIREKYRKRKRKSND